MARRVLDAKQSAVLYATVVLLASKHYVDVQRRLLQTQKARTECELRNLKAQIDPHFIFNNLNVLRGLIQQDPAGANECLGCFANLGERYRPLMG